MINSDEITNDDRLFELVKDEYYFNSKTGILAYKAGFSGDDFFKENRHILLELCEAKADEIIDTLCDMPDEVTELVKKRFRWVEVSAQMYADLEADFEEETNANQG